VCFIILGNKIGMTQIFDETGKSIPVTILRAGPCFITQIKTMSTDGYNAVQIGYSIMKPNSNKKIKPILGHFKKSKVQPTKYLTEFKVKNVENYKLGDCIDLDKIQKGSFVDITGKTIGKGFAGNEKRNNFKRGLMTHGSKNHRAPGSIGASTYPGRVFPGKRMAGHLGNAQRTVKNLQVLEVNSVKNIVIVKGCVPGKTGNLIRIKPSNNNNQNH